MQLSTVSALPPNRLVHFIGVSPLVSIGRFHRRDNQA
jgi:hypothetical protein